MMSGAQIPPYYDSMIAKLVSHGATREEARRKLQHGVEDAVALGVITNQAFLARCLSHPVFAHGAATTAFISQHLDDLLRPDADIHGCATALAAALLFETAGGAKPQNTERRLTYRLPISLLFEINGSMQAASLTHQGQQRYDTEIGDRRFELNLLEIGSRSVRFICGGIMQSAVYIRDGARLLLHYRGQAFAIEDRTRAASVRQTGAGGSDGKLRAAMNGRVVAILAAVGDRVNGGQPIITLEAMKMEHIHAAPLSGVVKALHVTMGDQVSASRVVAEIEADAAKG